MTSAPDYYEILQVSPKADAEIIQAAYRRLAQKWHPDKNPGDPFAHERMKLLNEAYETLSDAGRREEYDTRRHKRNRAELVEEPCQKTREQEQPEQTGYGPAEARSTASDVEQRAKDKDNQEHPWLQIGVAFGAVVGLLTLVYGTPKQIAGMFTILFLSAFYALKEWQDEKEKRGIPPATRGEKKDPLHAKVGSQKEASNGDVNGAIPARAWIWFGATVGLVTLLVIAIGGMASKNSQQWTEEEKANAVHFFVSQKAMERAYSTVQPYVGLNGPIRGLSESDTQQVTVHLTLAVTEAKSVSPQVLAKAHSQLPDIYKNKYIRSLELAIRAHQSGVPNTDANLLWNQWEDWWAANKKDVRFPDDVRK